MRLLERNGGGDFSLTKDFGDNIPRYAILSHTWGADTEEVTFKDMMDGTGKSKTGYDKIRFCGEQARLDGIQYFWVDTCCIDKSNSTELSKAINSMFRWYRDAAKCYVLLSDVSRPPFDTDDKPHQPPWESAFRKSRWFTRGWTLQELIAPTSVEFFSKNWEKLGDKASLEQHIREITGIPVKALQGVPLSYFDDTERMSWVENRETTCKEDKAYSLLGIFDVSMTLIYGEGPKRAFGRLQDEICKRAKKRHLEELSTASQRTLNYTQRSKIPRVHSSVPSHRDRSILDPEPLFYSEYSVHSIDATTKQLITDQLYFTKIDERLTSLTAAQGKTCRWFLTKSEYKSWQDEAQQPDHGGFLWIQGKPGTGKSTLMKLLFEEARLNAKGNSSQIILSFFFLARGTAEEKSATGLYRSLLHQLFEKVIESRDILEWMTADGARVIQRNGWHEEALKQTLTHAVQKLGSRSLAIFVDALDECDKTQVAGMICFFEELCDRSREAQVRLQICFSSRHYPAVIIQKGIEVTLEDEIGHTEDIKQYIKSRLRIGKSKQAESLRSEILEKSSSIFLWVVLVLDILNSEYPTSSVSIKKIRERLKEIPPELNDLFEMILTRDGENLEQLQVCLKWILFAARPLKPQELYFAIQLSLDKDYSSYWDQEDVELDQIKTFVRSSSKGLAEITRNKASEVQFIHESIRDFLLGKYEGQWSGASGNFVGYSHEILRDCCLAQLNASITQDVDIPDPLPQASKAAQLRETISLKFPFLEYSVLNVFHHANSAQQNAIEQVDFLADFPLQWWVFLNNALERHDNRRYTESVSILYILAEKNLANLIRIHPQRESCFDVENERYGLPFFAALATGSSETVCVFLNIRAKIQPLISTPHESCRKYCQDRKIWANFGRSFHFSRNRAVSSYVAEYGDEMLLSFLLESGKCMPDSRDKDGRTLLSKAAEGGHEGTIKLLLETGKVDVNSEDIYCRTPLWWAAEGGHEGTFKLLLETGKVEINLQDKYGRMPLSWAIVHGYESTIRLLLETDKFEINSKDMYGRTALSLATERGQKDIIKLILEADKVEIESKDNYGRTPLSRAAEHGHEDIVKLLLKTGKVDVNSKDIYGQTPLCWAARNGRESTVKLLLETDKIDVNSKDSDAQTPLWRAAEHGHEGIVKLLLATGKVDVNSKDNDGRTPLWWAIRYGHEGTVKLLLATGKAKVDSKDYDGRTPLWWAIRYGHENIVKLLSR